MEEDFFGNFVCMLDVSLLSKEKKVRMAPFHLALSGGRLHEDQFLSAEQHILQNMKDLETGI
jgi:hypothetical protein